MVCEWWMGRTNGSVSPPRYQHSIGTSQCFLSPLCQKPRRYLGRSYVLCTWNVGTMKGTQEKSPKYFNALSTDQKRVFSLTKEYFRLPDYLPYLLTNSLFTSQRRMGPGIPYINFTQAYPISDSKAQFSENTYKRDRLGFILLGSWNEVLINLYKNTWEINIWFNWSDNCL